MRDTLERSGLDHGPISVHDRLRALGINPPSIASLARIFRETGVARREPRKKPRSAYRRFVYPAPNCLWQLDATEYVLAGGRKCVIFQLEDDHSRLAIASHAASGETSQGALTVVKKGIAKHGVPQRLLTDNGNALNPTRRGYIGQLVAYVTSLGVEAITGRKGRPTTQGKNERFHQTLFRWLDAKPIAATLDELQGYVDEFDQEYNTGRGHQGLPERMTPQQAWNATPVADPPRPRPATTAPILPQPPILTPTTPTAEQPAPKRPGSYGNAIRRVRNKGAISLHGIEFGVGGRLHGQDVHVDWDDDGVMIADLNGEILISHPWPPAGTKYVSNGNPIGRPRKKP